MTTPSVPLSGTTAQNAAAMIAPSCHGKKHDRTESSKNRGRNCGPENTVAVAERSQFRSTLNQGIQKPSAQSAEGIQSLIVRNAEGMESPFM